MIAGGPWRAALLCLVLVAPAWSCAARAPGASRPDPGAQALAQSVVAAFDNASGDALWSALFVWSDTGDVLFERDADQPLLPASNMKIVTLAAAAQRLGWDHRFHTVVRTSVPPVDGVVKGDLLVRGSGDPTLGWPTESATDVMGQWARDLRAQGVVRIEGDIVGDADARGRDRLGDSWTWDNLPFGYAAPYAGLTFHENVVRVSVHPASRVGEPAVVTLMPAGSGLRVDAHVTTAAPGTANNASVDRALGSEVLSVHGNIALGSQPVVRYAAVPDPPTFFLQNLRLALAREGIEVRGDIRPGVVDDTGDASAVEGVRVEHWSQPLRELAVRFMKVSQNLYGEALLHALVDGRDAGLTERRQAVAETLAQLGVVTDRLQVSDGSGLSRRNFLTARLVVDLLQALALPTHAEAFKASLPIAGVDGTLERRLVDGACTGRLRAKTGTLSHARALSGYITTRSGRTVTFSVIANNYLIPTSAVDRTVDEALLAVCGF